MKPYGIIFLSMFLLMTYTLAHGQKKDYSFRHINTENGLSQNSVLSIMQDKTGFMWFGTKDGLNRYDGNSIKVFKYDDNNPFSLGNNIVWSLLEMPDGKIWVGTDQGIYIYNSTNNTFAKFNQKTPDNIGIEGEVLDMKLDKSGCVWIASSNLFRYTLSTGELEIIPPDNSGINTSETQSLSRAWSINVDKDNQVWISFHYGGIRRYNPATKQFKSFREDAGGKDMSALLISKTINIDNDLLLIASFNDELKIMNKKTEEINSFTFGKKKRSNLFVRDMRCFSDGNYWIGTESGLYVYNPVSGETTHLYHDINDRFSLSDNAIYSMYEDREGGVWIGTYFGGINYFPLPYNHFEKYYPITGNENSISGERVSGISEDAWGNIWIGTEDAGLNMLDVRTKQFRHYAPGSSGLNYHNIHDVLVDGDFLWIATFSRGINVLNLKTKSWKYYVKGNRPGMLDNNDIFSLFKDKSGNIWVGTSTGALLFDRKTESFIKQDYMRKNYVSDIIEDALGQIWFATYVRGVYCYNPRTKELKHYNHDVNDLTSICHYKIISMFLDSRNRLWFASESKGICMFDEVSESFVRYGMKDGFSNNVIYKILEDNENNLWLSSNLGLMRFNPETKEVRIFTKSNGLPGNQFNYKSGYKDKTGKMYFGSLNGLISFQPKQFIENKHVPLVVITDFQLLNDDSLSETQAGTKTKKLKYTQSSFSIAFSSLSYVAPEMNKYAYKMEGLDAEWNYLSAPQQITYSNLKYGKYVFKVKASNNDGLWNEQGDFLEILIMPPFWQTTWAYVLYVFVICATLFYIIHYNKRKLENENRRKQRIFEVEKEKEIYNTKIEFFTNVAHEIRTPLTLIKGPLEYILKADVSKQELQSNLMVMEKNTDRLLFLINQLLDFRKTEADGFSLSFVHININDLLSETYERFKLSARQKHLSFEISLPANPVYGDVDKEALTKVMSNLFNNAIKYAEFCIKVELIEENDDFVIKVENDGEIIPAELRAQVFNAFFQINREKEGSGIGLALVRSLMDLHSGKVYLDTSVETKNVFVVCFPKKQQKVIDVGAQDTMPIVSAAEKYIDDKHRDTSSLLVVDDNEELLLFVVEKLIGQYVVFKANNGKEALKVLEKEMINLVISDIIMPQMDGFELCAKIKETPEYSHIPVILLTAKTNIQSKITGLESGADAYIEKPFSMEHLQAQISNLLDNRKKIKEAFNNSPFAHTGSIALTKSDEQFLNKLTEIIRKNMANPVFHVDQLAEELFMSRSSLLRKIKGISGSTPNDFIRLIRLKEAAKILKAGEYKVNEVCYLVGFSSTSYFSKAFQKQFGVLPKDFIKSFKK